MRIRLVLLFAVLLNFAFSPLSAQDNVIDEVVWVVGDEPILKSQVEEQRMRMIYDQQTIDGDPYCVIPEQMAIQKLFLNQGKIDSIYASDEDVIQRTEAQMNFYLSQIESKEKMEEYWKKSYVEIRDEVMETIKDQLVVQQVQQKIIGEIKITPSDVRKYYNSLPKDSLPYIQTQVEVQLVMFEPKIPMEEIDRVRNRLREFSEQINKGEREFSMLAISYSEDDVTARRGGEMGFMGKGQLVPEFANVAFNLQDPKKVSRIVESEYGFHIIQLIERRGDRINCRHILLKPQVDVSAKEETLAKLDSMILEINQNKYTFEQAAYNFSQDKETKNNAGLMQNPETGNSRFQMQELPQEVAKAIDNLEPGQLSKPFVMIHKKNNKEVCVVAKLKNRIPGHKANMGDDFQTIKSIVENRKSQEKITNWIAKKQNEIYIRINEGWRNCDFQYPGWVK